MAKSLGDWGQWGKRLTDVWRRYVSPPLQSEPSPSPQRTSFPVSGFRLHDNLPWPRSRNIRDIDSDLKQIASRLRQSGMGFVHQKYMDVLFTLGAHELEFTLTDANRRDFKIPPVKFQVPARINLDLIKKEAEELYTILEDKGFDFANRSLARNALTRMIRIAHEEALFERPVYEEAPHPAYKNNSGLSNHIK